MTERTSIRGRRAGSEPGPTETARYRERRARARLIPLCNRDGTPAGWMVRGLRGHPPWGPYRTKSEALAQAFADMAPQSEVMREVWARRRT